MDKHKTYQYAWRQQLLFHQHNTHMMMTATSYCDSNCFSHVTVMPVIHLNFSRPKHRSVLARRHVASSQHFYYYSDLHCHWYPHCHCHLTGMRTLPISFHQTKWYCEERHGCQVLRRSYGSRHGNHAQLRGLRRKARVRLLGGSIG